MNKSDALVKIVKGLKKIEDKHQCLIWYYNSIQNVMKPMVVRLWIKSNWLVNNTSKKDFQIFNFKNGEGKPFFFNWEEKIPDIFFNNYIEVNDNIVTNDPQYPDKNTLVIFNIGNWGILEIIGNKDDVNPAIFSVIGWLNVKLNEHIQKIERQKPKNKIELSREDVKHFHALNFFSFEIDSTSKSVLKVVSTSTTVFDDFLKRTGNLLFTDMFYEPEDAEGILSYLKEYGSIENYTVKLKTKKHNNTLFKFNGVLNENRVIGLILASEINLQSNKTVLSEENNLAFEKVGDFNYYEKIVQELPNSILLLDAKGMVLLSNKQFYKAIGYETSEIIGRLPSFLLPEDVDFGSLRNKVSESLFAEQEWKGELQLKIKSGEILWYDVHLKPLRNIKGEVVNLIVTFENIDERKHLEQVLSKARIDAEMLSDAKTQFLSMMSHELRNPLSAIIGNIELLEGLDVDKAASSAIKRLKFSSENLNTIINDILDFSKIEADQIKLEEEPFNLFETCNNIIISWKSKAKQKELNLNFEFDDKINKLVIGDEKRFTQVINNLLSNAIKFTDSNGFVTLRCELISSKNNYQRIKFVVEDSGIGINPDRKDKIFDRFIQESSSTNRHYGGTGLGLAISKELVEKMGGNLRVDSIKNVGSKFYFDLPMTYRDKYNSSSKNKNNEVESTDILKGKNVLMVDDALFNLQTFTPIIEKWGINCITAQDGDIAIEKIKKDGDRIDLVLMDLRMPNMNGIEATKIIRKWNWTGPIIAMTGEAVKETIDNCISEGMNDYIIKPFKGADLQKKLIKHLSGTKSKKTKKQGDIKNTIKMNKKLYDLTDLSNLYDGDEEALTASLKSFTELIPEALELLQQRFKSKDWKLFSDAAHKLKTPVRLLHVAGLGDVLQQLEDYTRDGTTNEKVPELLIKVELVLNETIKQINEELS